ncbi:Exopolyphosphatase [Neurospora sp. IMI 360204]|nr:Exopolyphosphatase [Neurospora sp. IMI 360204]
MAPTARRVSLKKFLLTARKALLAPPAQRPNPLIFVVGNESADLDSLCSSILLAYFRTYRPSPGPPILHIPLSNLPQADLALRPELAAVLKPAGLHTKDLITLDGLPKDENVTPDNTQWFLVDHNALTGPLAARGFGGPQNIIGCIDHHDDEGVVPDTVKPRIIEKSGSCMSLVVEYCKPVWEELSRLEREEGNTDTLAEWESQLARLALAPILVDTTNLTSKDKTTSWDEEAVEFVEGRLRQSHKTSAATATADTTTEEKGYDRIAYFNHITSLKEDIAGLSYRDILRKDYKRWTDGGLALGISTVVRGFGYLLTEIGDQKQFTEALRAWAKEQELDIAAVMTVSNPDGKFTRELLVWAFNEGAVKVAKRFVDKNGGILHLQTWGGGKLDSDDGQGEWVRCWTQGRVDKSRKQVAPMLRDVMKEAARL